MQIDEGKVAVVPANEGVQYVVTSCLTVTCIMPGGQKVGAHYSLIAREDAGGESAEMVSALLASSLEQTPNSVIIAGQLDYWNENIMDTGVFDQDLPSQSLVNYFTRLTGCNNVAEYPAYDQVVIMEDGSYLG